MGSRISDLTLNGQPLEASKKYKVAGWGSVSEGIYKDGGRAIWDVVSEYLKDVGEVGHMSPNIPVIKGVSNNPGFAR